MSNQKDPMRTTVKPVHPWTTPDSENPRRRKIERWLFGAMFLWPVALMVSVEIANALHSEFANYLTYTGSTLFVTTLAGIALCNYPASRRFLKWLAAIILLVTLYLGVMAYGDSLYHGFWWVESVTKSPVFWLYVALVVLSVIYLAVPQRACRWTGGALQRVWSVIWRRKST